MGRYSSKFWRAEGEGTLHFANGRSVFGAWDFSCYFGFVAGRLMRALKAEARRKKIPGRTKIVSADLYIRRNERPRVKA